MVWRSQQYVFCDYRRPGESRRVQTGVGPPRKGRFKFLAAELPSEKSTEKVVAVVNRDSALWASGPMEGPVEKFIYESDEEAPRQWQVRPPAVVTEKAGGLPEEKGCKEESLEDSNKGSAEDVPQHLKVTCADQENGSYKDSNFSETHHDKDSASGGDASASGADTEEPKCADGRQHIPTSPLPEPEEKAIETNPEQAEEIKPSELEEDEDAEEPDLTCCDLCI
uniref:uncharacterized protein LOC114678987 isoform X3 n=1 Tax=Macaca mulatta TaxID=9544 RepID=UPI0010A25367|nr:uncharacterized protein LOC114678987 isoform X3 [Macaca mulatta]